MGYEVVIPNFCTKERAEEVKKMIEGQSLYKLMIDVREDKRDNIKKTLQVILSEI